MMGAGLRRREGHIQSPQGARPAPQELALALGGRRLASPGVWNGKGSEAEWEDTTISHRLLLWAQGPGRPGFPVDEQGAGLPADQVEP